MALGDVKEYYYKMLAQYVEMKADLEDYNQAAANGYITEDQLEEVKKDIFEIEQNYNRLTYIMYLLELPKRKQKRKSFESNKANKELHTYLQGKNADKDSIISENESVLTHLRKELKNLNQK